MSTQPQLINTWDGQTIEWPFPDKPAREVQLEALAAGFGKPGFAYFLRQRLGKTLLAFAEYSVLRKQGKVDWFFTICPNSLKEQWQEALEEVNPFIPIAIYESQSKKKTKNYFEKNKRGGVFIINYESLQAFVDNFLEEGLFSPERTYLDADESTKIKEPSAKMTKAAHALATLCTYKRVLTGKPSANSNADMWSQLKLIEATSLNFYQFKHYYVIMGGYQGRQVVKNINTEHLQRQMAPFCYIAPDKYIKGFEKVYEPMRKVNLGKLETQYKQMEDDLVLALSSDIKITAPIALTRYLRLQQISSGVAGDVDGTQHNLVDPFDNPRIKVVREIVDNEITNKVIIPVRFTLSAMNLKKVLEADGHKVAMLLGEAPMKTLGLDQHEEKKKFNDGGYNILLGQIQTMSLGHTLCGPDDCPCDSVIHYENDFSIINRMQTESRPEKFGRNGAISHYDLYASKMDRYMVQSLVRKEDASLKLMGYAREHGLRPELSRDRPPSFDEPF